MVKIKISCMDRRLNEKFDSENDGNIISVRNAGGNVRGVEQTVRYLVDNNNVREVIVVVHGGVCGGMHYVCGVIKENSGEEHMHRTLVDHFKDKDFSDREDLERKNESIQKSAAERIASRKGIPVTSEFVDIPKPQPEDKERAHVLVVTKASRKKYVSIAKALGADVNDCYFIQANSMEEITGDVTVAIKKLHIKDVRVVALESGERRQMLSDTEKMKIKFSDSKEVKISYADCSEVK